MSDIRSEWDDVWDAADEGDEEAGHGYDSDTSVGSFFARRHSDDQAQFDIDADLRATANTVADPYMASAFTMLFEYTPNLHTVDTTISTPSGIMTKKGRMFDMLSWGARKRAPGREVDFEFHRNRLNVCRFVVVDPVTLRTDLSASIGCCAPYLSRNEWTGDHMVPVLCCDNDMRSLCWFPQQLYRTKSTCAAVIYGAAPIFIERPMSNMGGWMGHKYNVPGVTRMREYFHGVSSMDDENDEMWRARQAISRLGGQSALFAKMLTYLTMHERRILSSAFSPITSLPCYGVNFYWRDEEARDMRAAVLERMRGCTRPVKALDGPVCAKFEYEFTGVMVGGVQVLSSVDRLKNAQEEKFFAHMNLKRNANDDEGKRRFAKWCAAVKDEQMTLFLTVKAGERQSDLRATVKRANNRSNMPSFEMMKYRLQFDLVNFCNRHGHRTEKLGRFASETVKEISNRVAHRLSYDDYLTWGDRHPNLFTHEYKLDETEMANIEHKQLHGKIMSAIGDAIKMVGVLSDAMVDWSTGLVVEAPPRGEYDLKWHAGRLLAINELLRMVNYGDMWSVMCYVARGDCSLLEMLGSNRTEFNVFMSTGGCVGVGDGGISSDMLAFAVQFSNSFLVCRRTMKGFCAVTLKAVTAMLAPCGCDVYRKAEAQLGMDILWGLSNKKFCEWKA